MELPAGTRLTPQRRVVLETLEREPGVFSVHDLVRAVRRVAPGIGIATIYRTLDLLRETEYVRPLTSAPWAYIRCRPGHHHHLICLSCGCVQETELCGAPTAGQLKRRYGFAPQSHDLDIYGTCGRCA